ncbi:UNVERIFIED_CONTAM: hypothetical protein GTU68_050853, partial [Idotea baltica]|nr:hypothetical protein [Idotea baltica]
ATGGRDGVASSEGAFELNLATPAELGGEGGVGTNPEQLFAAGYSACFLGALKFAASSEKIQIPQDSSVSGRVGMGPRSAGGFGLVIELTVDLTGLASGQAEALVQKADAICPYSNGLRGNVSVAISLV